MNNKHWIMLSLVAVMLFALSSAAIASPSQAAPAPTIVDAVRKATAGYKDIKAAEAAGYGLFHGCVSGQQGGSMGVHYANGAYAGDGEVDVTKPEALMYEQKNGKMQLLGVEYLVTADAWNANHKTPPVLMGQLFAFTGSPNRYGLPAFYSLHVWAWKNNPDGTFADFNKQVSCDEFTGGDTMAEHGSHG